MEGIGRSDEEELLEYQNGGREAFERLFVKYKHPVFNFALRILGNRADAEDVTGEIFLMLYSKKISFESRAKFSTWLFTIVRNTSINKLRKRKKFLPLFAERNDGETDVTAQIRDPQAGPDKLVQRLEASVLVHRAVQKLPLSQREAIVLREYHDMSYEEISQVLQCSLDNVKTLIFRARERLRKELEPILHEVQP